MGNKLIISWPLQELNPNRSGHWSEKAGAAINMQWVTLQAIQSFNFELPGPGPYAVSIVFFPPLKKRKRDLDNLIRTLKPVFDYIFFHTGQDDSQIRQYGPVIWGKPIAGGRVGIEFMPYIQENYIDKDTWLSE